MSFIEEFKKLISDKESECKKHAPVYNDRGKCISDNGMMAYMIGIQLESYQKVLAIYEKHHPQ